MALPENNERQKNLRTVLIARKRMVAAAAWLVVLALALTAATFAWFSSSRFTNVTPVAHTVSEEGYDLLISSSEAGPFDTQCTLSVADKTLYPISTADLSNFGVQHSRMRAALPPITQTAPPNWANTPLPVPCTLKARRRRLRCICTRAK